MRHVFFRDFSMARAATLAGLIALAVCIEVPGQTVQAGGTDAPSARIIPAVHLFDLGCDKAEDGLTL
ncbi:hypothetical protein VK792_12975 [Mesobacterium sp. TK19101]|uniref:Uncharacterized protein n=1 Tax=Mesobacterium hydrothermale TaxID=3111907 RepID=A0ABU6HIB3_9RHOB|nr:hypothetical protein [Mesobacterium sp. TK19101]MEC3862200.1 hypothetical protein [Mesobacterium sp. TK19101]